MKPVPSKSIQPIRDEDLEQQYRQEAGAEPQTSGAPQEGGSQGGNAEDQGGPGQYGQGAGARGSSAAAARAAIERARQSSLDFARGDDTSRVTQSAPNPLPVAL
jgi:hypothetical protein